MSESPEHEPAAKPDIDEPGAQDLFDASLRSVERIDQVLSLVRRAWLAHPDERFFQMTANLAARMGIRSYAPILEDDAFIDMLERHLRSTGPQCGADRG